VGRNPDWIFIIVGDTKTPHDDYRALAADNDRILYLGPERQERLLPELSSIIGWRSSQRRNLGMDDIWGAYALQPVFSNSVVYHRPTVYQERNVQDLVRNLEDEILRYQQSRNFIEAGTGFSSLLPKQTQKFWSRYRACYAEEAVKSSITSALGYHLR
jgi:hypothetical protein